jgi:hypothetical protein
MSIFSNRKPSPTAAYPQGAQALGTGNGGVAGFTRVEAFLTPERIKDEFLWGINLVNPIDKRPLSDNSIKNIILRAYSRSELELNLDITSVTRSKRIEYDRTKSTQGWNSLDVTDKNIRQVHELSIRALNSQTFTNNVPDQTPDDYSNPNLEGQVLYQYPLNWINMSLSSRGQLSLSPLLGVPSSMVPNATGSGAAIAAFLSVINRLEYMPGFWFVRYTCGFEDNAIPMTINEYVGLVAAREIISLILTAIKASSTSISHDGSSQSIGNVQPQVLKQKLEEIDVQLAKLKNLIKSRFTNSITMSNI